MNKKYFEKMITQKSDQKMKVFKIMVVSMLLELGIWLKVRPVKGFKSGF
ncbi:MAG: hypothetical protein V1831_03000 [Candidatus Woesearchaeota archaeon]